MLSKINPDELTPMMQQYYKIKMEFKDSILLFRLGDFYEMFFDDAIKASKELEIVLTSRSCGLDEKAPMAGIPFHTADTYITKLVNKGYRVAICEQVEDPSQAEGLVERSVVRVVSPGMNLDIDNYKSYNYLMSLYIDKLVVGISYIDITTGDIKYSEENINPKSIGQIIQDEIAKIKPSEIIINKVEDKDLNRFLETNKSIFISYYQAENLNPSELIKNLERHFSKSSLKELRKYNFALISLASLIDYVYSYEKSELKHFKDPTYVKNEDYMYLDAEARYNLDVSKNKDHDNSLIDLLDDTVTPMGSRLVKSWIESPLKDIKKITWRQDLVEEFFDDQNYLNKIRSLLAQIYDIERLIGKLSYSRGNARDLNALKNSLEILPLLKEEINEKSTNRLSYYGGLLDPLEDIFDLIDNAIVEDPPTSINEGGMIRVGFSNELDSIRNTSLEGEKRLEEYEIEQKAKTGIKNLKIVHNKNTGYFLDVTKSNLDKVPLEYHRVQTLTNSERFITNELKEIETMIFTSNDDTEKLENYIFNEVKDEIVNQATRIQSLCEIIAILDVCSNLAKIAYENNYVRPKFNKTGKIEILEGRHPMIEKVIGRLNFIPNDIVMDDENLIQIITGPNMSGKSTYLRQTALIVIMAQIGSYVPAKEASLPIVDKVFTRIGAADNIIHGDSTFMVEMKEMASIINNATSNSLLLLDEVGRGTSTYDGISLAWAIVEYISKNIRAKTLFATHYQELVSLSDRLDNVENYSIKVDESKKDIIFLYKIEKGTTSKSFGIQVAKLAGLPESIIIRAGTVLSAIETTSSFNINDEKLDKQLDFASLQKDNFINQISNIDINKLSPLDSLKELNSLIESAKMIEDNYD